MLKSQYLAVLIGSVLIYPAVTGERVATIYVRIVSPAGFHAHDARILLVDEVTRTRFIRTFQTPVAKASGVFTINDVPFGTYDMTVETPVLAAPSKPVRLIVNTEKTFMTLCLPWDVPIDSIGSRVTSHLSGECPKSLDSGLYFWIRIVGVYSTFSAETECNERGLFEFPDLPDGDYIVIATGNHRLPLTRIVRLKPGSNSVTLSQ